MRSLDTRETGKRLFASRPSCKQHQEDERTRAVYACESVCVVNSRVNSKGHRLLHALRKFMRESDLRCVPKQVPSHAR